MRYWPSGKQNLERTLDRQLCGSLTRQKHEKTVEFVFVYAGDNFFPPQAPLLVLYPPSSLKIKFLGRWSCVASTVFQCSCRGLVTPSHSVWPPQVQTHMEWNDGNLARYVELLPEHRWIRGVLAWHARRGRLGRPFMAWDTRIQNFGQRRHFGKWMFIVRATDLWQQYLNTFSILIFRWLCQWCWFRTLCPQFVCRQACMSKVQK